MSQNLEDTNSNDSVEPQVELSTYQTSTAVHSSAFVCGILSIVLSNTLIPGLILGIIAIRSANKYYRSGGKAKEPKTGKTLGIIGVILSAIAMVITLALFAWIFIPWGAFSGTAEYLITNPSTLKDNQQSFDPRFDDDFSMRVPLNDQMELLANKDPETVENIASIIESSFDELMSETGLEFTLEQCGINSMNLALTELDNFTYSIASTSRTQQEVSYWIEHHNPAYIASEFEGRLLEIESSLASDTLSPEEAATKIGEALVASYDETRISKEEFKIDAQREDDAWMVSENNWESVLNRLFALTESGFDSYSGRNGFSSYGTHGYLGSPLP